jgi:hypothetical protein
VDQFFWLWIDVRERSPETDQQKRIYLQIPYPHQKGPLSSKLVYISHLSIDLDISTNPIPGLATLWFIPLSK